MKDNVNKYTTEKLQNLQQNKSSLISAASQLKAGNHA